MAPSTCGAAHSKQPSWYRSGRLRWPLPRKRPKALTSDSASGLEKEEENWITGFEGVDDGAQGGENEIERDGAGGGEGRDRSSS